jgi:hypothetical protein
MFSIGRASYVAGRAGRAFVDAQVVELCKCGYLTPLLDDETAIG